MTRLARRNAVGKSQTLHIGYLLRNSPKNFRTNPRGLGLVGVSETIEKSEEMLGGMTGLILGWDFYSGVYQQTERKMEEGGTHVALGLFIRILCPNILFVFIGQLALGYFQQLAVGRR